MTEAPVCSICTDVLKDPRALPCGHTYCGPPEKCLKTLQQPNGSLKCALCDTVHELDVDTLTPLYGIRDYLSGTASPLAPPVENGYPECDTHEDIVAYWCIECSEKICETCLENDHDGHSVRKYKKHVQECVNDRLKGLGAEKDAFRKEMEKTIDYCYKRVTLLNQQIEKCQTEIDAMEKNRKTYEDLLEGESQLRAFSNGSSDIDLSLVDSYLALMDKSLLFLALKESPPLVHKFTIKTGFEDPNSWQVNEHHLGKFELVNDQEFQICAQKTTDSLALFVHCYPSYYGSGLECKVKHFILCLKNSRGEKFDKIGRTVKCTFDDNIKSFCCPSFIEWNQLLRSGFLWNQKGKSFIFVQCTIEMDANSWLPVQ